MVVLDHLAFGARERSEAANAMAALGFATSPACSCEWETRGTRHSAEAVCCVFQDDDLDLVIISDPAWRTHLESSSLYGRGLAPTGIVLSGRSLAEASRELGAAPHPIVRHVDGDPPTKISYEFLSLARLGLPLGLIDDSAPDLLRRVAPVSHPNTVSGIARLHLRVPSLDGALRQLAREPLRLESAAQLAIGKPRLCLHERIVDDYLGRVAEHLPATERPTLLAIEFSAASLQAASDALQAGGVGFRSRPSGLSVDPEQGFGTGIVFTRSGPLQGEA